MQVASVNHAAAAAQSTRSGEAAETPGMPDHDGDADDRAVQAQAAATPSPSPTVNGNGQVLGQIVSTRA